MVVLAERQTLELVGSYVDPSLALLEASNVLLLGHQLRRRDTMSVAPHDPHHFRSISCLSFERLIRCVACELQAQALMARAFAPKASPTSKPPPGIVNAGNELIAVLMLLDRPESAEAVLRGVNEVEDWSPRIARLVA
jgi:hypothetical protein